MVISPGIPHNYPTPHPAAAHANLHKVSIISEVERLRAKPKARLVAITGTNGKSTTTALIGHCLQTAKYPVAIGGNLGNAACSLDDPGEHGTLVLELSSYHRNYAIAENINFHLAEQPRSLDRHGGMAGYVAAKAVIWNDLKIRPRHHWRRGRACENPQR